MPKLGITFSEDKHTSKKVPVKSRRSRIGCRKLSQRADSKSFVQAGRRVEWNRSKTRINRRLQQTTAKREKERNISPHMGKERKGNTGLWCFN